MHDYLEHHRIKITALTPIHIGDGTSVGKKEYIRRRDLKQVIIPDKRKMFLGLQKLQRDTAFERYMLDDRQNDLGQWIKDQRIPDKYIDEWTDYVLNAADAFRLSKNQGRESTPKDNINCFIKDAYGMPYVPGSSIKGMIRTALAAYELNRNKGKYSTELRELKRQVSDNRYGKSGTNRKYMLRETANIETAVFNILERNPNRQSDAVNSLMSGLIVSDSEAITTDRLTLSQKIDYTTDGKVTPLPILRETIIPGTDIIFDMTIDKSLFGYSIDDIMSALELMNKAAYKYFYSYFGRGSKESDTVWLGGGAGFVSKTFLYAVYQDEATEIIDSVFWNTVSDYQKHHHNMDIQNGIAPHMCKCTLYQGKLYDMGMGKIEVIE